MADMTKPTLTAAQKREASRIVRERFDAAAKTLTSRDGAYYGRITPMAERIGKRRAERLARERKPKVEKARKEAVPAFRRLIEAQERIRDIATKHGISYHPIIHLAEPVTPEEMAAQYIPMPRPRHLAYDVDRTPTFTEVKQELHDIREEWLLKAMQVETLADFQDLLTKLPTFERIGKLLEERLIAGEGDDE